MKTLSAILAGIALYLVALWVGQRYGILIAVLVLILLGFTLSQVPL